jgi:tape measure domain-containing protein
LARSVGTLKIVLTGQNAELKSVLKDSQSHVSGMSGHVEKHAAKVNSSLKSMGHGAGAVFGGQLSSIGVQVNQVGESLTGLVTKFYAVSLAFTGLKFSWDKVAAGFEAANEAERIETKMEILTGSATKAKKQLDELKEFSGTTPFGLAMLEKTAVHLTGIGVSAEELIPTMRTLGDLSLGEADAFDAMVTAYTNGFASRTMDARALKAFTQQSIPIYEELAKVMGTSAENVKALVREGEIGFGDFQKALNNLTGESGQFNASLEKMAGTTEGKLGKMHRAVSGIFKDFAIGVKESFDVKGMLDGIIAGIGSIRRTVVPILVEGFASAAKMVMRAWDGVKAFWKEFGDDIIRTWNAIENAVIGGATAIGRSVINALAGANGAIIDTAEWAETLHKAFTNVAHVFENLPDYFELALVKMEKALRSYVRNMLQYTLTAFNSFLDPLIAWFDGGQNFEAAKAAAAKLDAQLKGNKAGIPLEKGVPDRGPVLDRREQDIRDRINAKNGVNDNNQKNKIDLRDAANVFNESINFAAAIPGLAALANEAIAKPFKMLTDMQRQALNDRVVYATKLQGDRDLAVKRGDRNSADILQRTINGVHLDIANREENINAVKVKALMEPLNTLGKVVKAITGVFGVEEKKKINPMDAMPPGKDEKQKKGMRENNPAAEYGSKEAYSIVARSGNEWQPIQKQQLKAEQEANRKLQILIDQNKAKAQPKKVDV